MAFNPTINQEINLQQSRYRFTEHPAARDTVYGQAGRRGTVYQLSGDKNKQLALKVFRKAFRTADIHKSSEQIAIYASMPGLQVCRRTILTAAATPNLVNEYPDLEYAVVMPWVRGETWQEILNRRQTLEPELSWQVGRNFCKILESMEQNGLAHCDLSSANVMVDMHTLQLSLVDLEEMFGPGFARPDRLSTGSDGYGVQFDPESLWSAQADRLSGAIIIAEMLAQSSSRFFEALQGENFFATTELQTNNERYALLLETLEAEWGSAVAELFQMAWNSSDLSACPTFQEWFIVLDAQAERFTQSAAALRDDLETDVPGARPATWLPAPEPDKPEQPPERPIDQGLNPAGNEHQKAFLLANAGKIPSARPAEKVQKPEPAAVHSQQGPRPAVAVADTLQKPSQLNNPKAALSAREPGLEQGMTAHAQEQKSVSTQAMDPVRSKVPSMSPVKGESPASPAGSGLRSGEQKSAGAPGSNPPASVDTPAILVAPSEERKATSNPATVPLKPDPGPVFTPVPDHPLVGWVDFMGGEIPAQSQPVRHNLPYTPAPFDASPRSMGANSRTTQPRSIRMDPGISTTLAEMVITALTLVVTMLVLAGQPGHPGLAKLASSATEGLMMAILTAGGQFLAVRDHSRGIHWSAFFTAAALGGLIGGLSLGWMGTELTNILVVLIHGAGLGAGASGAAALAQRYLAGIPGSTWFWFNLLSGLVCWSVVWALRWLMGDLAGMLAGGILGVILAAIIARMAVIVLSGLLPGQN